MNYIYFPIDSFITAFVQSRIKNHSIDEILRLPRLRVINLLTSADMIQWNSFIF